jgi:tellurite resistance protein TehA-like permease
MIALFHLLLLQAFSFSWCHLFKQTARELSHIDLVKRKSSFEWLLRLGTILISTLHLKAAALSRRFASIAVTALYFLSFAVMLQLVVCSWLRVLPSQKDQAVGWEVVLFLFLISSLKIFVVRLSIMESIQVDNIVLVQRRNLLDQGVLEIEMYLLLGCWNDYADIEIEPNLLLARRLFGQLGFWRKGLFKEWCHSAATIAETSAGIVFLCEQ